MHLRMLVFIRFQVGFTASQGPLCSNIKEAVAAPRISKSSGWVACWARCLSDRFGGEHHDINEMRRTYPVFVDVNDDQFVLGLLHHGIPISFVLDNDQFHLGSLERSRSVGEAGNLQSKHYLSNYETSMIRQHGGRGWNLLLRRCQVEVFAI